SDAAAGQVGGCPASGELGGVGGLGVAEDGHDARARPGRRPGRGRTRGRSGGLAADGLVIVSLVMPCGRGGGLLAGRRDGRGVVAVQDAVGVTNDAGGDCGDAVPGGEDGGRGLGARVSAGPACRVGEFAAGGDAVPGAGDVGDGVGFGLAQSCAAGGGRPGRVTAGCAVQQDVAELVRQRPGGLFAGQAGQEPDAADGPGGGAVGGRAVFTLDGEFLPAGAAPQRGPQARRGLAGRGQPGRDGERLSGRLRQVPDVGDAVGVPPGRRRLVVVTLVTVLRPSGGRPGRDIEGLDAFFVAADLLSGRGPLAVVPDHGGAGPLGGDEQDVREVLAGHECGHAQPRGPVAGGAQCLGVSVGAGAGGGQLLLALVLPGQLGGGGTRGHPRAPGGPAGPD